MKQLKLLLALSILMLPAATAIPQELCPCIPQEPLWTIKTCADAQCAADLLAAANGDPLTFIMPVGTGDVRWIVMRRVNSGQYGDDGSDPFQIEQFDGIAVATARFDGIAADHHPMIISAPDGMFLIASLKQAPAAKQRVVTRH